ncbi:hypothetical protein BKA65DRAFT_595231 [Rhexocercosporidium sp. MPI-PUGE-AT-0058]|nr:hypothetical protein BKA65DRAFT_595231 [Rhexocercosporidium sp. MPI-PUGE-AT-0058]
MRRPGRIRSRMLLLCIALFGIIFIFYGRRHTTELQFSASTLTNYIPTSITDAIATYGEPEPEDTRWNDVDPKNDSTHIVIKKPKFHLFIPAHKPTANLCKTLLSAAILNYPPPIIISCGESPDSERPGLDVVKNIFSFLLGKEVHDDDLVLIVDEGTIFQLPAEIVISRFLHISRDISATLLSKYGLAPNTNHTHLLKSQRPPKYTQKILFGATKSCSSSSDDDAACFSIPESPLLKSTYSSSSPSSPNNTSETNNPPHHISPSLLIGRASSLRPLYKHLLELLEFSDLGKKGSKDILTQIFSEQEHARALYLSNYKYNQAPWWNWFSSPFSHSKNIQEDLGIKQPNNTLPLNLDQNSDFGISLDYQSNIFQTLKHSIQNLESIHFDQVSDTVKEPTRIKAASYAIKRPIRLPQDLRDAPPPPFVVVDRAGHGDVDSISVVNSSSTDDKSDSRRKGDVSWASVPLLTNIVVPGASVPAAINLNLHDIPSDSNGITEEMWGNIWYHNTSRSLLHQYFSHADSNEPLSINNGEHWFDIRAGKGGIWTQRGEWIAWGAVCAGFEEGVFGDGLGAFEDGREKGGEGGNGNQGVGKEDEEEGMVKGFWGKIVKALDGDGEEKGEGDGEGRKENWDVVGGFSQGDSVENDGTGDTDSHAGETEGEDGKDWKGNGEDGKNEEGEKGHQSHENDSDNHDGKTGEPKDDAEKNDEKKKNILKIELDEDEKEIYKDN